MSHAQWSAHEAIANAPCLSWGGTVWRTHWNPIAAIDWAISLRTSGRYHRGLDQGPESEAWPVLYTSLDPENAVWEMVRRSLSRNPQFLVGQVLSEIEVSLSLVLDGRVPEQLGLTLPDMVSGDPTICQELAAAALNRGYEGLLVPAAGIAGRHNLVLLPQNLPEPPPLRVWRTSELRVDTIAKSWR